MILRDILDQVIELAGQDAGGDFETKVVLPVVQRYNRTILAAIDQLYQKRAFTFATVASTADYGMPLLVNRILDITDTTNRNKVEEITEREYRDRYPGDTATGPPEDYLDLGFYGVQTQPAAAGTVTAESDSTADTGGNYLVRLQGTDASGIFRTEKITLTGTSAVTSSNTYETVTVFVKSTINQATFTGNITLKDSGGNTLAVLPPGIDAGEYRWIKLRPISSSALTLNVRAVTRVPDIYNDDDWPSFDSDYHSLLVLGPGSEIMPLVGKRSLGAKMGVEYDGGNGQGGLLATFKGTQQRKPNRILEFANVTNAYWEDDVPRITTVDGVTVL